MAQKRSIADMVAEEEREAARRAAKKKEQDEKMAKMAAKLAAAQESIKQRTTADQKRLIQAEQQDRRKFIDSTESEANTEEFRQSKRSTLEVAANAAKDKNFQELVRKRQNHENRKSRNCGEWKRGHCERGDQCKFKHDPRDHPLFSEYVRKNGKEPESLVHFQLFDGVI
eukprot:Rhum_TRINITY_DN13453_c0_g1::Rhum_TRINITY_DN13453_c0_g1_i3::g.60245::m.60245